jgi:hypothetical protein
MHAENLCGVLSLDRYIDVLSGRFGVEASEIYE